MRDEDDGEKLTTNYTTIKKKTNRLRENSCGIICNSLAATAIAQFSILVCEFSSLAHGFSELKMDWKNNGAASMALFVFAHRK